MFIARSPAGLDDRAFAALDALAEGALCLVQLLRDGTGGPADLRVLRVGRRFEAVTGLVRAEGRLLGDLLGGREGDWLAACGEAARSGEARACGLRAGDRALSGTVVPVEEAGCLALAFRDETEIEALRRLHRELSHRVMNSFASLSAMMALEARGAEAGARAPILRLQGRVQAMGALYRQLDGAGEGTLDVAAYLRGLAQAFAQARGPGVAVEAVLAPLVLPARRAGPLGLLVNELMGEAAARADGAAVRMRLTVASEGDALRLLLEDDAPPAGEVSLLAQAFAAELGGTLDIGAGTGGGRVALTFRR
jgi:two-component sensor histidine kinase